MRLKVKITLGLVFLFSVIVLIGILAINYLNALTVENQRTLQENYAGIENLHDLSNALRELTLAYEPRESSRVSLDRIEIKAQLAIRDFESSLANQLANNSDPVQEEMLREIEVDFAALKAIAEITRTKDYYFERLLPLKQELSTKIDQVFTRNQNTIVSRNQAAGETAKSVIYTVGGIIALCVIVAFTFLISFPRYVSEPLEKITEALNQVEAGSYKQKLEIESKDEFGKLAKAFNAMFERLDAYESLNLDRLMLEKKRLDTLIRKINEGVVGLDAEMKLLFLNPFARTALNVERGDVEGKAAQSLTGESPAFQELFSDLIEWRNAGTRYTRNKLIKAEFNGKPMYFVRKVIVIPGSGEEKFSGLVIMLKNITEFKEQDEARRNFIATVSHELKTPIAAIKLSLKLLRDKRLSVLNEDQEELVESVELEANRLLNISQELLNANELENGQIRLYPERVQIREIVDEAVDAVWTLAEDKRIELEEHIQQANREIVVDADKITWVLVNLLTNAIKYTYPDNTVQLKVRLEEPWVYFDVVDRGVGIAEEHREKIFERYYRIHESKEKGTGLGLSISKDLIVQMGGSISLESELGVGSTFSVRLPIGLES